jgi:alpha-tubulin suppressor-like RCC1 family protein
VKVIACAPIVMSLLLIPALSTGCSGSESEKLVGPTQVVVSHRHRCLTTGGRVWCWGAGESGQIGPVTSAQITANVPVLVAGLDTVVELAASDQHTCARLQDGRVACWGANGYGESALASAPAGTCTTFVSDAGDVDITCQPSPTLVPGLEDARQLALGDQRSCARRASGAVHCWGQSARGAEWAVGREGVQQLAIGDQTACVGQVDNTLSCSGSQPGTISAWAGVEQLAMSARNGLSCVRHDGGRVNCWADNASGQRGIGNSDPMIPLPGDPPAIAQGAAVIAVGWSHVCALVDSAVFCWGRNGSGAVGLSVAASESCPGGPCLQRPRKVEGLPPLVALAAGGYTTCALTAEHRLFCWGELEGRDSDGRPTDVPGPWEAR